MKHLAILSFITMGILGSCIGNSYGATPTCSSHQMDDHFALACAADASQIEIHQGETLHLRVSLPSNLPVNTPLYWDHLGNPLEGESVTQNSSSETLVLKDGVQIEFSANPFTSNTENQTELTLFAKKNAQIGKRQGQNFNITRMDTATKLSLGWFYIKVLPEKDLRQEGGIQNTCKFIVFCSL
jgi:hypothetical protein